MTAIKAWMPFEIRQDWTRVCRNVWKNLHRLIVLSFLNGSSSFFQVTRTTLNEFEFLPNRITNYWVRCPGESFFFCFFFGGGGGGGRVTFSRCWPAGSKPICMKKKRSEHARYVYNVWLDVCLLEFSKHIQNSLVTLKLKFMIVIIVLATPYQQIYSETCLKRTLKNRQNKGLKDSRSKVLQNAPREHSAILLTCIKLLLVL